MTIKDQRMWRVKPDEEGESAIKGKYGIIHQYADGDLDIWITAMRVSKLAERQGWKAAAHYDDGAYFVRPYSDLNKACQYIRARKKIVLSLEQRTTRAERLAKWRQQKAIASSKAVS